MKLINHPILCNYYLTYRCNAKCGFCDIWEKPSPYATLENVSENLSALKKLKVKVIDFTGGEPLLHRQLPEFLALAKAKGFITTVTTNALLYPKYGAKLRGLVDMLHFSLDSADQEKHDASRGVKCYDTLVESIELARSWKEKPDILFTVTDENVDEIEAVYERFSQKYGLILILNPLFAYNQVGGSLQPETLIKMRKWRSRKRIYLNEAFLTLRERGGNQIDDPVCRAASSTVVISPENSLVLPCYHLNRSEIPIDGNLESIYKSDEVKKVIAMEGRYPQCQGCEVNCYMEPSFATELNANFFRSIPSTLKYSWEKWIM